MSDLGSGAGDVAFVAAEITAARRGLRVSITTIDENLAVVLPAGALGTSIVVSNGKAIRLAKS